MTGPWISWRYSVPMLLLAVVLGIAIGVGYWVSIQNRGAAERSRLLASQVAQVTLQREKDDREHRRELDLFLKQMCVTDAEQNAVITSILKQSPLRVDPAVRARYDAAIMELLRLNERCTANLPPR